MSSEVRLTGLPGETPCRFTLRAAGIILRDGCLLLAKHAAHDCFYLPGGGVRLQEDSAAAIARECREETGCTFQPDRLLFVQERFFTARDIPCHEVTFFYLMRDDGQPLPDAMPTDHPGERLYWAPLSRLAQLPIVPAFLASAINRLPAQPRHIITRE